MKYEVWYSEQRMEFSGEPISRDSMRRVTPEVAQFIIDAGPGKCNFLLLPNGGLILRVYSTSENGYQFYPLNSKNFEVRLVQEEPTKK